MLTCFIPFLNLSDVIIYKQPASVDVLRRPSECEQHHSKAFTKTTGSTPKKRMSGFRNSPYSVYIWRKRRRLSSSDSHL